MRNRGDDSWLAKALSAAEQLPLLLVPRRVSDSLHRIMADRNTAANVSPLRVEIAVPIHDSRSGAALVGVRGEYSGQGWTAMYTAASADVILDGDRRTNGSTEISGQLLMRTGSEQQFDISVTGQTIRTTSSDDAGQFCVGELEPGEYKFSAQGAGLELRWTETIDK